MGNQDNNKNVPVDKLVFKNFAKIKGLLSRLQYQRNNFERYLRIKAHFNINLTEKLPSELRISHLPLSFHFYDAVPIMMARYLT
jgi:hypothetical protein